jgi:hypothetical protein
MLRIRSLRVTAQLADTEMCAEYCAQTGRLRILKDGAPLREWFPPNSWIAVASAAGARNWGTRPDSTELRALLESQMSLLHIGWSSLASGYSNQSRCCRCQQRRLPTARGSRVSAW